MLKMSSLSLALLSKVVPTYASQLTCRYVSQNLLLDYDLTGKNSYRARAVPVCRHALRAQEHAYNSSSGSHL